MENFSQEKYLKLSTDPTPMAMSAMYCEDKNNAGMIDCIGIVEKNSETYGQRAYIRSQAHAT